MSEPLNAGAAVSGLSPLVGLVDGSVDANTHKFEVALAPDAAVQLDELVVTSGQNGTEEVAVYGIVVEVSGTIEGAEFSTDTERIAHAGTMPGALVRSAQVQVLRTVPERWIGPTPGAEVRIATEGSRDEALFLDQMQEPLPVGVDQTEQPVHVAFEFLNGAKGGHVSISGISGVATKTSYATFLLYMLLESDRGRNLLGVNAADTRALVFNVKGEELLHLDRRNKNLDTEARRRWSALGVDDPGPFTSVALWAPRSPGQGGGNGIAVTSRTDGAVRAYGWTPQSFVERGLLRFVFSDPDDRRGSNQVSFVEQRIRNLLRGCAYPHATQPGGLILIEAPHSSEPRTISSRTERGSADGVQFLTFDDLVGFLESVLLSPSTAPLWGASTAAGTVQAFLRRLYAQQERLGRLIATGVHEVNVDEAGVNVVDIHDLHDSGQRFVVGALLHEIFESKQGTGRLPLRIIVLDELNKYAPREGSSPIRDLLVDIAARGRSLGVILLGAQQSAGDVDANIIRNASIKVVGRLDSADTGDYGFLTSELRERAARFLPGTMVLDQPLVPAPIPIRFPFPGYATNVDEAEARDDDRARDVLSGLLTER